MDKLNTQETRDRVNLNMRLHEEANHLKDRLEHKGFKFTISLYGVVVNRETKHREYRRVEVFMNGTPKECDVYAIRDFFNTLIPYHYYSIWIYNTKSKKILLAKSW